MTSPEVHPNQLWQSNDDRAPRTVRVLAVDCRFAEVRNVATNRISRIDLATFARGGRTGWTCLGDAATPLPAAPTVVAGQEYRDRVEEVHGRLRTHRVTSVDLDGKATCESWFDEPGALSRTTRIAVKTLLGSDYRLLSEPEAGA